MSPPPLPVLLQSGGYKFFQEADTLTIWIFAIVVAVFLILLVFGSLAARRRGRRLSPEQQRRYNRFVFARMAQEIGLQKSQVETLEHLVKACKVMQPFLLFSNPGLLDDVLRKGIYSLQKNPQLSEEEREKSLAQIFEIKQLIERNSKRGVGIRSTALLRPGQRMVIATEAGGQYTTQVVSNMKDMLAAAIPGNASGQEIRLPKGTMLKASFWREGDAGYGFETKVLGYDTVKGVSCLLIQHSKTLRREQRRKHRRRPLERPCFFYPIQIVESAGGGNRKQKAVVQSNQKRLGTLLDISAGGCSISSRNPLPVGNLVRVDFDLERGNTITAYGKVRRFREDRQRGRVIHIMFTRVSGQHLNRIYSYVYNYTPQSMLRRPV